MIADKLQPHHLKRKAVLYVRQSSAHQVLHNRESGALQYAMRDRLAALGWSEIEVIDDDLGRSAAGGVRIYVIRTNLPADAMSDPQVVASYKSLSQVERAFRSIKTVDLEIRPIYHWLEDRVRAHVLLCMLAYHVEWHMRGALGPMLYEDDEKEAVLPERSSPVAKAPRSDKARAKEATHRTADGLPVHSFQSLIADLGTLCPNTLVTATNPDYQIIIATRPTPIQAKAFELLGVPPPTAASDKAAHRTQ